MGLSYKKMEMVGSLLLPIKFIQEETTSSRRRQAAHRPGTTLEPNAILSSRTPTPYVTINVLESIDDVSVHTHTHTHTNLSILRPSVSSNCLLFYITRRCTAHATGSRGYYLVFMIEAKEQTKTYFL
jgi:hypothetical protein